MRNHRHHGAEELPLSRLQFLKLAALSGGGLLLNGCEGSSSDNNGSGDGVHLTFDDGPGRDTPDLLDALQGAPATFFMLGRHVDAHPELARMVKADGHTIGNHSYSHVDFDQVSEMRVAEEIDAGGAAIVNALWVTPHVFRPPYLSGDAQKDQLAVDRGYRVYRGFNTHDYQSDDPKALADYVLRNVAPGLILMFHDSDPTGQASRQVTVEAIRILVPELRRLGFSPRRL